MPTGDSYVNLALKRFLSQNRMSGNFLNYLQDISRDALTRIFPIGGIFTYPCTITPDFVGNTFSLTDPLEGIDNQGHVFSLSGADITDIPYEDVLDHVYWIALHYIIVPDGVYANPRSGLPEYDKWQEAVGESNEPDAVVDDGDGTMTVTVNSVLQENVDHSGRIVRVWLKNPMSITATIAYEDCPVLYAGGDNYIETAAALGQSSISVSTTDYTVALLGPVVYDAGVGGANPFGDDYTIVGNIVGQSGTDTGEQRDLSGGGGHTLQRAYDGLAGDGSGRTITVNDEAVLLVQSNTVPREHDIAHAALRVDKSTDVSRPSIALPATEDSEIGIDVKTRIMSNAGMMHRVNLMDVTLNDFLRGQEEAEVTANGDIVTLSRAGVDLDFPGLNASIVLGYDLVELSGSVEGNDGLYIIMDMPTDSTLQLYYLDMTGAAALIEETAGTLQAKLYRPILRTGYFYGESIYQYGVHDFAADSGAIIANLFSVVPSGTDDSDAIAVFARDGSDLAIIAANGDISTTGDIHTDNDVTADNDVNALNDVVVTNDYTYAALKTVYYVLHPTHGQTYCTSDTHDWIMDIDVVTEEVSLKSDQLTAVVYFPFRAYVGMTLVEWEAVVTDTLAGTITGEVVEEQYNWGNGAVSCFDFGSDASAGDGTRQVIGSVVDVPIVVTNDYALKFVAAVSGAYIHVVKLTFRTLYVRP